MSLIAKVSAVVSSLILLISGLMFLVMTFGMQDTNLDLGNIKVQQQTNIHQINDITIELSSLIRDYNDYQAAKKTQLEGDKQSIQQSANGLNTEIERIKSDDAIIDSNIAYLEKQTELIYTSGETAIEMYYERKEMEKNTAKPEDNVKKDDTKPEDKVEEPKDKPEDNPEDKVENEPKEKVEDGADSVVLKRPKHLPHTYSWPVAMGQKNLMMQSIVYMKTMLFNYFKPKLNEKGEFDAFSKEVPAYFNIGQIAMAYAIFKQETNTDVDGSILKYLSSIGTSENSTKVNSSELAFTIIGVVAANLKAKTSLTNTSAWKPLEYSGYGEFNEGEKKLIDWAIKILLKRQTNEGGWSNTHIDSDIIYDFDVVTTSLALYALTQAYQAGFTDDIKEEMLIKGVDYLVKMQIKSTIKKKSPVLNENGMPFDNCIESGWGFNELAKPTVRTTATAVAAITNVMHILHKIDQKHDALIEKYKICVVNGLTFIAGRWEFSEDFYTNWAVVQACAAVGVSKIGAYDVYSECMTYFANRTLVPWISKFSFSKISYAYWCMKWAKQETGFFKPMKIAGYEEETD